MLLQSELLWKRHTHTVLTGSCSVLLLIVLVQLPKGVVADGAVSELRESTTMMPLAVTDEN